MSSEDNTSIFRLLTMVPCLSTSSIIKLNDESEYEPDLAEEINPDKMLRSEATRLNTLRNYIQQNTAKKDRKVVVIVSSVKKCKLLEKYIKMQPITVEGDYLNYVEFFNSCENINIIYIPVENLDVIHLKMRYVKTVILFDVFKFQDKFELIQDLVGRTKSTFIAMVDPFDEEQVRDYALLARKNVSIIYKKQKPQIEEKTEVFEEKVSSLSREDSPLIKPRTVIMSNTASIAPKNYKSIIPTCFNPDLWKFVDESGEGEIRLHMYLILTSEEFFRFANREIESCPESFSQEVGFAVLTAVPISASGNNFPTFEALIPFEDKIEKASFRFEYVGLMSQSITKKQYKEMTLFQEKLFETIFTTGNALKAFNLGDALKKYMIVPVKYIFEKSHPARKFKKGTIDWNAIKRLSEPDVLIEQYFDLLKKEQTPQIKGAVSDLARKILEKDGFECKEDTDCAKRVMKNLILKSNGILNIGNEICEDITPSNYEIKPMFDKKTGRHLENFRDYLENKNIKLTNNFQPMLKVKGEKISNILIPEQTADAVFKEMDFIPELCEIVPLSVRYLRMGQLLISILHRWESIAIAEQLKIYLKMPPNIPTELVIEAITSKMAKDTFDYERLETLGDSFLKLATSCDLLVREADDLSPSHDRTKLVSNRNLYDTAIELNIPGYIQERVFTPRDFVTIGDNPVIYKNPQSTTGSLRKEWIYDGMEQNLPMKRIADVMEALLAATYLGGGCEAAFTLLKDWKIINRDIAEVVDKYNKISANLFSKVSKGKSSIVNWKSNPKGAVLEYAQTLRVDPIITARADGPEHSRTFSANITIRQPGKEDISSSGTGKSKREAEKSAAYSMCEMLFETANYDDNLFREVASHFKNVFNYEFKDANLLLGSINCKLIISTFKPLKFVGNAVLEWLVTYMIFSAFPSATPYEITKLRTNFLRIMGYAGFSLLHLDRIVIREASMISGEKMQKELENITDMRLCDLPPEIYTELKLMSDCLESIVGAVFIDSGFDINVIYEKFGKIFNEIMSIVPS